MPARSAVKQPWRDQSAINQSTPKVGSVTTEGRRNSHPRRCPSGHAEGGTLPVGGSPAGAGTLHAGAGSLPGEDSLLAEAGSSRPAGEVAVRIPSAGRAGSSRPGAEGSRTEEHRRQAGAAGGRRTGGVGLACRTWWWWGFGMGGFDAVWAIDLLDLESLLEDRAGLLEKEKSWGKGIVVWFRAGCASGGACPEAEEMRPPSNCRGAVMLNPDRCAARRDVGLDDGTGEEELRTRRGLTALT
ncbi:hypothetical protein B0T18DRAFT_64517 [Schizothecium vesticola]|uniref:Uncharacterized protein n=1 Tax=Schizothecium vesticola TaxID=314040 RepID=A0AA40K9Y3_9PEZI|nr:hypothetical protein B0T18DRAFT_64517 [Schizothecium vesticola]